MRHRTPAGGHRVDFVREEPACADLTLTGAPPPCLLELSLSHGITSGIVGHGSDGAGPPPLAVCSRVPILWAADAFKNRSRRFAKSTLLQIIRTAATLVSFALSFVPCSSRRTPDHRARLEQRLRLRQAWIRRIFRDGPTQLFSMTDLWARLANGRTHANDSESWFTTA